MAGAIRLQDLIEAMDRRLENSLSFANRDTGKVVTVSRELLGEAEESDEEEFPPEDNSDDEWDTCLRIASNREQYVRLPEAHEIRDWNIMEDFALSISSPAVREDLLHAINGPGAFRMFRDLIRRRGIQDSWNGFRDQALQEVAREWCRDNDLTYQ